MCDGLPGNIKKPPAIADVFQIHAHDTRLLIFPEIGKGIGFVYIHLIAKAQHL